MSRELNHELRAPLEAILGALERSLKEPLSDSLRECITTACRSARQMQAVLDGLADDPQARVREFELAEAPFELRLAVATALAPLELEAEEKELEVRVHVHPEVPRRLRGDVDRVCEILTSLLRHAMEVTESSTIHVELGIASTTARTVEISVRVANDIPSTRSWPKNLFDDTDADQTESGSRLDLAICHHWIQRMGGRLWFDPEWPNCVGGTVRLRRVNDAGGVDHSHTANEEPSASRVAKSGQQRRRSLRVLVVDDMPWNQKIVSSILTTRGHQVEVADNGRSAVDCLCRHSFDVVLMDVQMPVMDGLEASKNIRGLTDRTKAHVPIIAMTANATRDSYSRCMAAGMDAYLPKPISAMTLVGRVESSASPRVAAVRAAAQRRLVGD